MATGKFGDEPSDQQFDLTPPDDSKYDLTPPDEGVDLTPPDTVEGALPAAPPVTLSYDQRRQVQIDQLNALHQEGALRNPDRERKALAISGRLRVPVDTVYEQLPEWEKKLQDSNFDAAAFYDSNPEIAKFFIDNPNLVAFKERTQEAGLLMKTIGAVYAGASALGDWSKVFVDPLEIGPDGKARIRDTSDEKVLGEAKAKFEKFAATTKEVGIPAENLGTAEALRSMYREASAGIDLANINWAIMREDDPEKRRDLIFKAHSLKLENSKRLYDESSFNQLMEASLPALLSNWEVLKGAGKSAGLAGAATYLVAYAGSSLLGRGAVPANKVAWSITKRALPSYARAGIFATSLQLEAGGMFSEVYGSETLGGTVIDYETAKSASYLYGAIAALIEVTPTMHLLPQFGQLGKLISSGAGKEEILRVVKSKGFLDAAKRFAPKIAKGLAKNSTEQALEEGLQQAFQEGITLGMVNKADTGEVFNVKLGEKFSAGKVDFIRKVSEAATGGFLGTPGIHILGAGSAMFQNQMIDAYKSMRDMKAAALVSGATEISTLELADQAPQIAKQLIDMHARSTLGGEVQSFYIDAKKITEMFQGYTDEALKRVLGEDGPNRLTEALNGRDSSYLKLSVDEYMSFVKDQKEFVRAFKNFTTTDPGIEPLGVLAAKNQEMLDQAKKLAEESKSKQDSYVETRLKAFVDALHEGYKPVAKTDPDPRHVLKEFEVKPSKKNLKLIGDALREAVYTMSVRMPGWDIKLIADNMIPDVRMVTKSEYIRRSKNPNIALLEPARLNSAFRNRETGQVVDIGLGVHDIGLLAEKLGLNENQSVDLIDSIDKWEAGFAKDGKFLTREEAKGALSTDMSIGPGTRLADMKTVSEVLQNADWGDPVSEEFSGMAWRRIWTATGRPLIELTNSGDLGTVFHELGHIFYFTLEAMAKDPRATDQIKADFATLQAWFEKHYPTPGATLQEQYKSNLGKMVKFTPPWGSGKQYEGAVHSFGFSDDKKFQVYILYTDDKGKQALAGSSLEYINTPLEVTAPKALSDDEPIVRKRWEMFAEAMLKYIRSGVAPSVELVGPFSRFRRWVSTVRRTLWNLGYAGKINSVTDPNPAEVDQVFDRMFATDAQMQRMAMWRKKTPVLRSADEFMAMYPDATPEEYQQYLKYSSAWLDKTMNIADKEALKEAYEFSKSFRDDWVKSWEPAAREMWQKSAEAQAANAVLTGEFYANGDKSISKLDKPLRFNREGFVREYGEEAAKRNAQYLTTEDDDPRVASFILGHENLDWAYVLDNLSQFAEKQFIYSEAVKAAERANPSVFQDPARLENLIGDAMHNEHDKAWLMFELKVLRSRTIQGPGNVPLVANRMAAEQMVMNMELDELTPRNILRSERRAAERSLEAVLAGNFEAAYLYKQQQLLHSYVYDLASQARAEARGFKELLAKMKTKDRRAMLRRANKVYLDVSDQVLEALGILKTQPEDPANPRQGVAELVDHLRSELQDPEFNWIDIQTVIDNPGNPVTVAQMRQLRALFKQITAAAKVEFSAIVKGKHESETEMFARMAEEASANPERETAAKSLHPFWKGMWAAQRNASMINAALMDPELMFNRLGNTATSFFWDRYINSRNKELELGGQVLDKFNKMWTTLPKELRTSRYDRVNVDMLPWNRRTLRDRTFLWMVMLNWGNLQNRDRLLAGYGWTPEQVQAFFDANNIKKEEWDFVQSVWDLLSKDLWPEVANAYERVNGVRPERVVPVAIDTPFGKYEGGYFPIKYERTAQPAAMRTAEDPVKAMFQEVEGVFAVANSMVHTRSESAKGLVQLDWDVLPNHITKVIHYVAYDAAVRDWAKRVQSQEFEALVDKYLGQGYYLQIKDWLYTVALGHGTTDALHGIFKLLLGGRNLLVMNTVGYNIAMAAGDLVTPITAIFAGPRNQGAKVGARYIAQSYLLAIGNFAAGTFSGDFNSMRSDALKLSKELGPRADHLKSRMHSEIRAFHKDWSNLPSAAYKAIREYAFWFMEWTDKFTATIIWHAAFTQAQAEGMEPQAAARDADQRVRANLPTHFIGEKSTFLRDRRGIGASLAFYSYFNKLDNVVRRRIGHDFYLAFNKWGEGVPDTENPDLGSKAWNHLERHGKLGYSFARMLAYSVGTLAVSNVLGELLSGRGKEDDESWNEWMLRKTIASPAPLIPWVGPYIENKVTTMVTGKKRQYSIRAAPALAAIDRIMQTYERTKSGKKDAWEAYWMWLDSIGLATGVPTRQFVRTGSYLQKVAKNQTRVRGPFDLVGGTLYGEGMSRAANPFTLSQDVAENF